MTLMFALFAVATILEATIYMKRGWRYRRWLATLSLAALAGFVGVAAVITPLYIAVPLIILSLYRVLNLYRSIEGKSHEERLRIVARLSFIYFGDAQVVFVLLHIALYNATAGLSPDTIMLSLSVLVLFCALLLSVTTGRSLRRMRMPSTEQNFVTKNLPTVTVAIPARNETLDLEDCLKLLVKSTYPKLEILVLDDCSQNKRTPEIIRQFAHDGVRFIAGDVPEEEWLAKNYAYQRLANEANGEVLLFCGVDVRFEPQAIRQIVESMLAADKDMVSLMPMNTLPKKSFRSLVIQPMRYAWELSLPRNWSIRPPTLSTCWAIRTQALQSLGGFEAVRRTILPERYFARQIQANNRYGFYVADTNVGLGCEKQLIEQRDTAIRMRYPQLYKRLELLALLTAGSALLAFLPPIIFILAGLQQQWMLMAVAGGSLLLLAIWYSRLVQVVYRQKVSLSWMASGPALLYDIYLLHVSFWRYEFSEVIWKGRNICIPVMQVYPSLPKLK